MPPDINEIILKIHSTVMEPQAWRSVMGEVAQLLSADSAMLFSVPAASNEPFWNVLLNLDPAMFIAYANHFVAQDEWLIGAKRCGREATGIISLGEQLVDRSSFLKSEYYNDFLTPFGMDRFANVCLRGPSAPGLPPETGLSFFRRPGRDAFTHAELEVLGHLSPHLVLAISNLWQARALALRTAVVSQALDRVAASVYAIDARGHLVYANRGATDDLSSREWVMMEGRKLVASSDVRERQAVHETLDSLRKGHAGTVLLNNARQDQAVLTTAPLRYDSEIFISSGAVGVAWVIPLRPRREPVSQMAALFLLTPAEARILRHLVGGGNLESAAADFRVTENTVRAQLKSIFRKTGRRSQGQLLALVQRMGAVNSP